MLFATYNVHYGVGADGKYDVARVADAVREADIVCLQEVTRGFPDNAHADQTAEIGKRLNRYYRFHGPMEADASTVAADGTITSRRRSFGNAIVSRWPILWSRGVMLPKKRSDDTFDLQRGYIEAVVAAPSGPLRVYCTHLSHISARERLPQISALVDAVERAADTGATWMPWRPGVSCSRRCSCRCLRRRSWQAISTSRRGIRNIPSRPRIWPMPGGRRAIRRKRSTASRARAVSIMSSSRPISRPK
jgi:endonuclease/exonuclease/phosphatase family metal-dependent hydrolase